MGESGDNLLAEPKGGLKRSGGEEGSQISINIGSIEGDQGFLNIEPSRRKDCTIRILKVRECSGTRPKTLHNRGSAERKAR